MRSKEQLDALEARVRSLEEQVARLQAGKPAAEDAAAQEAGSVKKPRTRTKTT